MTDKADGMLRLFICDGETKWLTHEHDNRQAPRAQEITGSNGRVA